ncbi:MAG: hypothetical protein ACK4Q5_07415 [Saprospiraceae bacterium]
MKIITTVGTSLITNAGRSLEHLDKEGFSTDYFKPDNSLYRDNDIGSEEKKLEESIEKKGDAACAELASLDKIDPGKKAEVHLLCTETVTSYMCGRVLKAHFEKKGRNVLLYHIEGLKIDKKTEFEEKGIPNLMAKIQNIVGDEKPNKCVLNISGGYKALIPVLTIMGQLYKIPLSYIYEDSKELISITQQGLGVDWAAIEQYASFLKSPEEAKGGNLASLRKMGLISQNEQRLTVMGKILSEFLEKNEPPFGKTAVGYMVEYKVWEYLTNNLPERVEKVVHALKSEKPEPGKEMDDIDIWMQTSPKTGIGIEFKPIGVNANKLRNSLRRHETIATEKGYCIEKYWVVVYSFESRDDSILSNLHISLNKGELAYPVEIKFLQLSRNIVDGETNRFNQHNFWRSEISDLFHYSHSI